MVDKLMSPSDRPTSQANGQNCIGIERFIVHRSIYNQFIALLTPRVKSLRCGSSLSSNPGTAERPIVDCGAMISDQRFDELETIIRKAVDLGAKLVCGGKRKQHEVWKEGHYFEPTMLIDVTVGMDVARQERE
jgi:acyl-CoA reductase-like NAD-dependent aldehyde dehydrogenase